SRGEPRRMGGGDVRAALKRVVGRRSKSGLRTNPRGAGGYCRVEEIGEGGGDRRKLGAISLGARRPRRILALRGPVVALSLGLRRNSVRPIRVLFLGHNGQIWATRAEEQPHANATATACGAPASAADQLPAA